MGPWRATWPLNSHGTLQFGWVQEIAHPPAEAREGGLDGGMEVATEGEGVGDRKSVV